MVCYAISLRSSDDVRYSELPAAVVFMHMRNLAMSTGHDGALLYLYRILQRHASNLGILRPNGFVERQLTREYGAHFERVLAAHKKNVLPKVPEVSAHDAKRCIRVLKDIGRFKDELEYYNPEDDNETDLLGMAVCSELTWRSGWTILTGATPGRPKEGCDGCGALPERSCPSAAGNVAGNPAR
jgi:hypothetical protein